MSTEVMHDTLFRRALYGGRKGKRAARRLGAAGYYAWFLGQNFRARINRSRVRQLVAHERNRRRFEEWVQAKVGPEGNPHDE